MPRTAWAPIAIGTTLLHIVLVLAQNVSWVKSGATWASAIHLMWMNVAVALSASLIVYVSDKSARRQPLSFITFSAVLYLAIIFITLTVLGAFHLLTASAVFLGVDLICVLAVALSCRAESTKGRCTAATKASPGLHVTVANLSLGLVTIGCLVLFMVAAANRLGLLQPTGGYDDLSFHLPIPVAWLHSASLRMPAQPFGDPSPLFYPINAWLYFLWFLLPFGNSDFGVTLAPFFATLILFVALLSIAKNIRLGRFGCAVTSFGLLTVTVNSATGYGVQLGNDIALAAHIALLLACVTSLQGCLTWFRLFLCFVALGLVVGTKSIGIVFVLPVALVMIFAAVIGRRSWCCNRRRLGWVGVLLLATIAVGGFSYIRNTILAGNPVYPAEVRILDYTLFAGPRTKADYQAHPYHNGLFSSERISKRTEGWQSSTAKKAYALWIKLGARYGFWWQLQLFAGLISLLLLANEIVGIRRRHFMKRDCSVRLVDIQTCWVQGAILVLPWVMAVLYIWQSPYRITRHLYSAAIFTPLGLGWLAAWAAKKAHALIPQETDCSIFAHSLRLQWGRTMRTAFALSAIVLALGIVDYVPEAVRQYNATKYQYYVRNYKKDESALVRGWSFINELTRTCPMTVAYSGGNIPYLLHGERLQNRVVFVPRNRQVWSAFYDFGYPLGDPTGNGGYFRRHAPPPSYELWRQNLEYWQVDVIFVQWKERRKPSEYLWAGRLVEEGLATELRHTRNVSGDGVPSRGVRIVRLKRNVHCG